MTANAGTTPSWVLYDRLYSYIHEGLIKLVYLEWREGDGKGSVLLVRQSKIPRSGGGHMKIKHTPAYDDTYPPCIKFAWDRPDGGHYWTGIVGCT